MRLFPALAASLLLLPALGAPTAGLDAPLSEETFVLVMQGHSFNLQTGLVLETYVGDVVHFQLLVPPLAETHTFHLHGHPWLATQTGRIVDTWRLDPGEADAFAIIAGGPDAESGDWMFHCHFASHAAAGMWGVLRVYPYRTAILAQDAASLVVRLDRLGAPVEGAHLMLAVDGAPLGALVTPLGAGEYRVDAPLPATGVLTVMAHAPGLGESVARVGLGGASVPPLTLDAAMPM